MFFGKAAVHTEKIPGKQSGFVTACPGPYFKKNITLVVRVFGDQKLLQLAQKRIELHLQSRQFFLGHFPNREIIVVDHNLGLVEFLGQPLVFLKLGYHRGDIRKFNGQATERVLLSDHAGIRQECIDFFLTLSQVLELFLNRRIHGSVR